MAGANTQPVRVRYKRPDDTGDGSRVVAYRGTCACGRKTPSLSSVAAVRAWKQVHTAQGHPEV